MSELGQLSVAPEVKKAVAPDVVKIGDSERKTPEASRAGKIADATMVFLGDLSHANIAAKKELGELASTRIGKAIAVGAAGAGLEWMSGKALGMAIDKLLVLLPSTTPAEMKQVQSFLNHPFIREAIEDASVYKLYKEGNKLIGDELPDVPVSYLGAAVGVNALDWAVREQFHSPKPMKDKVDKVSDTGPDGLKLMTESLRRIPLTEAFDNKARKGRLDFIPRTAATLADVSNPVTLYGTAQVVEGVSAYIRAVRDVRRARKVGGEGMVNALLMDAKKEKFVGKKRDKQERILDMLEAAKDNGK